MVAVAIETSPPKISDAMKELAAEAEKLMRKAIELEDQGHANAFAASGVGGNKWQRVQALQAQAQVHATLALAEATARGRIGE